MLTYASIDPAQWAAVLDTLRPLVSRAQTLEGAAQLVARGLYEALPSSTALARVYAVVPHGELPGDVRAFVADLMSGAGPTTAKEPTATMPVLALLGTYGSKPAHCDRKLSQGHKGIPLVSAAFVDAIPMLARLLRELGIDLAWLDDAPEVITRRLLGGFNGLFYVDDARTVRDAKRRLVIPATDFVAEERVRTVFGMGGFYPNGTMIVCIVFTREAIPRGTVERLTSLISMLKGETFGAVLGRRIFTT